MLSRLPIRARLTVAFGLAMLLMLASAALFVYVRLRADINERIDATLESRIAGVLEPRRAPGLVGVALEDPQESFVQLFSTSGELLDSVGNVQGAALSATEAARASTEPVWLERDLPGLDGPVRLLARAGPDPNAVIVVAGQSFADRDDALSNLVSSFALGGVFATLVASVIGYLLATAGLAPVEAMRRRARQVSLIAGDEGLPLPVAKDEIRRLGETLNEMLVRLRAAFERESRFVSDASHELRTPVAIIKTELEGALQVAAPGTPVHSSLVAAAEECDRLGQLAEDLLVIARAAEGQLPIRVEPTDVRALLVGVQDRFADRAGRRGRAIRVGDVSDLFMDVDPVRMRQALGNLVENALRHGEGEIRLEARRASGGIEIDVSDDGVGFAPGYSQRAFERFSRGDRSRSGDGVGLGLAIVATIAQAHGGRAVIAADTPPIVRIILPGTAGISLPNA